MKRTPLSIPEIGLIAATRAALGGGIALLLADRLDKEQRRAIGWSLVSVGLLTTIPIMAGILGSEKSDPQPQRTQTRSNRRVSRSHA